MLCSTFEKNRECNSSIPHITGQLNNDLYAVPVKRQSPPASPAKVPLAPSDSDLPAGWEKHEGTHNIFSSNL